MIARLYLISPERIDDPAAFASGLRAALDGGDVAAFQLFLPDADDTTLARAADTLRPVCQQRNVAFILGGRPDLAVKLDCDGVQVGIEDYAEARRLVGRDRQVGVFSPASRHLAMEVAEAGADYVAFDAGEIELIEWWSELFEVPCVAVGDIALDNVRPLLAAGADFIAVGNAVWDHADGPEAAVRAFDGLLSAAAE
ncbi:MAG: thiamine phosphate synthase [Alphaproteobacteria bacterium]|nr:thiamine phosphate synthase [Alphaproteobacteria bacterium]